jgi:hypothetical protein
MLWPEGENVLVDADHGDIAGCTTVDDPYRKADLLEIGSAEAERGPSHSPTDCCAPAFSLYFSEDSLPHVLQDWCPQRRSYKIAPSSVERGRETDPVFHLAGEASELGRGDEVGLRRSILMG